MKINKGLKVNRGEDMDGLYESMEYDFLFLEGIDKVVKKGIEVGLWKGCNLG